jgi:membrane-associated protein
MHADVWHQAAELFAKALDIFFHLDAHLTDWAAALGPGLYGLLFAVVFCETGLVVTPFLPGDSLLFATGALAALEGSPVRVSVVLVVLIAAAVLGDAANYSIGKRVGPRVFRERSRFLNQRHLERTHAFYERHGGKTIILARFIPMVRTFAPFVAGIGLMRYRRFFVFNIIGAASWVTLFTLAGYWFGNMAGVRRHFQYVILAIILISVVPVAIELWRSARERRTARCDGRQVSAVDSPPNST